MCTAVTYRTYDHYFGRNLDLPSSYQETVTITPRNFPLPFRRAGLRRKHYAIIGVALVDRGYPLYYDATNEKGLSIAGLNFPGNADFKPEARDMDNIAPYELIPWLLGQCTSLDQVKVLLRRLNLIRLPFSERLPLTPLHWMISDRDGSMTLESVQEGLRVYDNPVGVLTNNPPFDFQMHHLTNFLNLTRESPTNRFSPELHLEPYSLGMGALGLPGDLSSASRFVRAAFTKLNSVSGASESESISQCFHILGSVAQYRGCARAGDDGFEHTLYTSCCNTDRGLYYYTTYENSQITCVDLHRERLDSDQLVVYPMLKGQRIYLQNGCVPQR